MNTFLCSQWSSETMPSKAFRKSILFTVLGSEQIVPYPFKVCSFHSVHQSFQKTRIPSCNIHFQMHQFNFFSLANVTRNTFSSSSLTIVLQNSYFISVLLLHVSEISCLNGWCGSWLRYIFAHTHFFFHHRRACKTSVSLCSSLCKWLQQSSCWTEQRNILYSNLRYFYLQFWSDKNVTLPEYMKFSPFLTSSSQFYRMLDKLMHEFYFLFTTIAKYLKPNALLNNHCHTQRCLLFYPIFHTLNTLYKPICSAFPDMLIRCHSTYGPWTINLNQTEFCSNALSVISPYIKASHILLGIMQAIKEDRQNHFLSLLSSP